jgi:hypothetical protein
VLRISFESGLFFVALTAFYNFGRAILKAAALCERYRCERPNRLQEASAQARDRRSSNSRATLLLISFGDLERSTWAVGRSRSVPGGASSFRVSAQLLNVADIHPEEVAASVHEE